MLQRLACRRGEGHEANVALAIEADAGGRLHVGLDLASGAACGLPPLERGEAAPVLGNIHIRRIWSQRLANHQTGLAMGITAGAGKGSIRLQGKVS